MQQNLQTAIRSFFIFGIPILLSIFAAFELGYFDMATKPSNYNLNGRIPNSIADPFSAFCLRIQSCPVATFISNRFPPQMIPIDYFTFEELTLYPSFQKAPRPLLSVPHDRFLPRRLLPLRPRRHRQPRHRWRPDERVPRFQRVKGE